MGDRYDAIIIGAGVIGAAIGLAMARRGRRTLNIDRNPAAGYGSTSSSCAIIRTHYSSLQGTAMAWESVFHWKNWAAYLNAGEDTDLASFREVGVLMLDSRGGEVDVWRSHHDVLGIPYEEWDTESLKNNMPFLSTTLYGPPKLPDDENFFRPSGGEVAGGFYVPGGGYINDPQLATRNLQEAAEASGGKFLFNAAVTDVLKTDGRCAGVLLDDGRQIMAPVIVNAAGPHSAVINRMAGVDERMNISTRAMRHEVHMVPAPAGINFEAQGAVISDADTGGYCRPESGNCILTGSQDPACDPHQWVDDPDSFDREVSLEQWRAQVYRLALRIPDLPIPAHPRGIADLYDVTEDWMPVYDRSDLPGFYMAVGTSGNQFKNAPVVGGLMSELIESCENGHDHDVEPVHYRCEHIDFEIDLGFYSRRREIHSSSSFSVLG